MASTDPAQRLEEIQLAMASLFPSPKSPSVKAYEEGASVYLQLSWVTESKADTTLDTRCVTTVKLAHAQLERYGALETAKRREVQQRLKDWIRTEFEARRPPGSGADECSVELEAGDALFEVPDAPYSLAP